MGNTPTSLRVVGILGIIYGAFILLISPIGLVMILANVGSGPTMEIYRDAGPRAYALVGGLIGFALAGLLLISSIGCLKAKPWARMGMNVYAIAYVIMGIVQAIFQIVVLNPRIMKAMAAGPGPMPVPPATLEFFQIIGAALGLLFVFGVALTILIIVNRKVAVDAFNGIFPADPTNFPVEGSPPPLPPFA